MALTKEERAFLRAVHTALIDRPLEPDDKYHVPIHERLHKDDPVLRMKAHIDLNIAESMQLFSGFSGGGKTTELFRLRRLLADDTNYVVLYASASDYITGDEPVSIGDMMMIVAGGFSDAVNDVLKDDAPRESFWDRLAASIQRTEVRLSSAEAKLDYSSPAQSVIGGLKAGLSIKAELKTGSSFQRQLQTFLSSYLVQLQSDVEDCVARGVQALRQRYGADVQVVFIFDQLEQVNGGAENWDAVIHSIRQLFTAYRDRLRLPDVHCVYSVPAWLIFQSPEPPGITMLPTVQLWTKDRMPSAPGLNAFRQVILRRLPHLETGLSAPPVEILFGPGALAPDGPIDRLIMASGCHVRDLLFLLREVLYRTQSLPVGADVVERVIGQVRRSLSQIPLDDAKLLSEIDAKRRFDMPTIDAAAVARLSRLCNGHMALYFENGGRWFDTNPLIREELERIEIHQKASP